MFFEIRKLTFWHTFENIAFWEMLRDIEFNSAQLYFFLFSDIFENKKSHNFPFFFFEFRKLQLQLYGTTLSISPTSTIIIGKILTFLGKEIKKSDNSIPGDL